MHLALGFGASALLNWVLVCRFQLYNTFKDRAKWVSFDTGEVELDDGATLPFVFR